MPPGLFDKKDSYARRPWFQTQYLADEFWRRWVRKFLPNITYRQKWQQKRKNLKLKHVVLIDVEFPVSFQMDDRPRSRDFHGLVGTSEHSVAATLSQEGRPVAFFSKTLNKSEKVYPVVEKEPLAIMEAVRRWSHYLYGKCFDLVTDQRALSFMLDKASKGKVKSQVSIVDLGSQQLVKTSTTVLKRPISKLCLLLNSGEKA